jgi:rhodanese-related sulfurtransferase
MYFNIHSYQNIGPEQLNEKMTSGEDFFLLDVRTSAEYAAQAIEGAYLIPLQEISARTDELPKDKEIVVYCRVGNRSAYAAAYLGRIGYDVKNLEGGIVQWNLSGNVSMAQA